MTYKRFEDLPVWRAAIDLAARVFKLVDNRSFNGRGDLRNQLQRAATSISNNVAEGFERGTTNELIAFLYYARGSAGEVRSMLCLCERMPYFADLRSEISDLKGLAESVSRQIRAWADSLQNSSIKGQRHLTARERQNYDAEQRATSFWKQLDMIRQGAALPADWGQTGED